MQTKNTLIERALEMVEKARSESTGGKWLESITKTVGPHIKDWDISDCRSWAECVDRYDDFRRFSREDIGIDCVAIRRSDDAYIAIQCKSRRIDETGELPRISKRELDSFMSESSNPHFKERWLVTNGEARFSPEAEQSFLRAGADRPIKLVNIHADLLNQQVAQSAREDRAHPHRPTDEPESAYQTKQCMQDEAVATAVRVLKEHVQSDSGGLPKGQARGKIILPCGTGKTRISLRIIEELTPGGRVSIVLCPSIALVAQIRREYLQHAIHKINALAVCSDETAGYDPEKEGSRNTTSDPTADSSNVSASIVKGQVTTKSDEIAQWLESAKKRSDIGVIFGTYQSAHRIADALRKTKTTACVVIGDEAHRTAGLRKTLKEEENLKRRNFTLCHDNDAFPATYRIYQTATPKVYDQQKVPRKNDVWVVRSMDDETVFGVELYRRSYIDAVNNGWLANYRIIAIGVNDPDAYRAANLLAKNTQSKGRNALTTDHYLRALAFALVMGGATRRDDSKAKQVAIRSCIAFMNTVDRSKTMTRDLQSDITRDWIQKYLDDNQSGRLASKYVLEHLDATSNVLLREQAKSNLAQATKERPHGILNVGIFGEGTDSPSLSAVAFLDPRKSPIDVIQAVGRAMRTAPGKELGYIICPISFPPQCDPEEYLKTSAPKDGWEELGQILLALRAHDERIEDQLSELITLYLPRAPERVATAVTVGRQDSKQLQHYYHVGPIGEAQKAAEQVLEDKVRPRDVGMYRLSELDERMREQMLEVDFLTADNVTAYDIHEIQTTHQNADGSTETRVDRAPRKTPGRSETLGPIDIRKTRKKAADMINKGEGTRRPHSSKKKPHERKGRSDKNALQMLLLTGLEEHTKAIQMNLLTRSGLKGNRVMRDLNILESGIKEAAHHLRNDGLQPDLDRHFGLDRFKGASRQRQADGCTIAALLMMNAAMLHQRIANGKWLYNVSDLDTVKNATNVVLTIVRQWYKIMMYDFRPVMEPAVRIIEAVQDTGRQAGLERALRHLTAEAERIAETYSDMGADHAGPLFNRVMGNQASDGAFFTRPVAASIAARLTLDACGETDWTDESVWRQNKTVDLACGSGTLLAAMLTDMKRRAQDQGASESQISALQKLAVEETIRGLDINPVSLQLAASQLTTGNTETRYRQMGLHLMPYGPNPKDENQVSVGTLELLGQRAIVPRKPELWLEDDKIASQAIWRQENNTELEDSITAVQNVRIVIMNPPFSNRSKMGEKFAQDVQTALRNRTDSLEKKLIAFDPELEFFGSRNTVRPCFVALADLCLPEDTGILTMITPTISLTATSGLNERRILARRYHIHTILTCHQPGNDNLSQNTKIAESILVMRRHGDESKPQTRFINLDRMPADEVEVANLHQTLLDVKNGPLPFGWGSVMEWPAECMEEGDWTPAIWRSAELAEGAKRFADSDELQSLNEAHLFAHQTGRELYTSFRRANADEPNAFPVIKSKGAEGQEKIRSIPDEWWTLKNGVGAKVAENYLKKREYLLITEGQRSSTARLVAVADGKKYIGGGWMPVEGLTADQAKATAVFLNSTAGRLQLMRNAGKTLAFPTYRPAAISNIRIPDIKDARIIRILLDCWKNTKDMIVPQFRDGECKVRRLWDEAAAEAMGWDANDLAHLRKLLHNEPHVRGLGYGQYAEASEDIGARVGNKS